MRSFAFVSHRRFAGCTEKHAAPVQDRPVRQPHRHQTAEGKAAKEAYGWEARSQWQGKPLPGEIVLSVTFYFKTKRRRDLDNQNKILFDALSGIVYDDDGQISELRLRREYDCARPRIEIQVQEAPAV